jgi:hypothetical protein
LVARLAQGELQISIVLVGGGKVGLEVVPSSCVGYATAPFTACLREHARCEDEVVQNSDDLGGSVGSASGIRNVDGFFDLMEEGFDRFVGVVRLFHGGIVVLDVGGTEAAVGGVDMD